jgi:hypothetical protein
MASANSQIVYSTGDPGIKGRNAVEFRLLYSGRLLGASRNDNRPAQKHEIRRSFHPQLRRLWATNQNLQRMVQHSMGLTKTLGKRKTSGWE